MFLNSLVGLDKILSSDRSMIWKMQFNTKFFSVHKERVSGPFSCSLCAPKPLDSPLDLPTHSAVLDAFARSFLASLQSAQGAQWRNQRGIFERLGT